MSTDRKVLEDELKALVILSADLARNLNTVTARMKVIQAHLDSKPVDRSTSPTIVRETRGTSTESPIFSVKIEKEDRDHEEFNEGHGENEEVLRLVPQTNLEQNTIVTESRPNRSNVTNGILYVVDTNTRARALPSNSTTTITNTNPGSSGSNSDDVTITEYNHSQYHQESYPDEDIMYATRMNISRSTEENESSIEIEGDPAKPPEITERITNEILNSRLRMRRTEEEKREYNRIRQARYRARQRKFKELKPKGVQRSILLVEQPSHDVKRPIILRKDWAKRNNINNKT